jgi:rubrerythrin
MASTITLVADSLSALAPVRVWECLCCGKRWATDTATGCPYCLRREKSRATHEPTPPEIFN